jgi:hypothetical protein
MDKSNFTSLLVINRSVWTVEAAFELPNLKTNHRFRIEHAQHLHPDDIQLRQVIYASCSHVIDLGPLTAWVKSVLIKEGDLYVVL